MRPRLWSVVAVSMLVAVSCSGDGDAGSSTLPTVAEPTVAPAPVDTTTPGSTAVTELPTPLSAEVGFTVTPSVQQVLISDAEPGASYTVGPEGDAFEKVSVVADENGFALFRQVTGSVVVRKDDEPDAKVYVEVLLEDQPPDQAFYGNQELTPGFGYITTRDGTQLSANIVLPGPAEEGPYPTVLEYSGYNPSDPSNTTFVQLYNTLGYAYVGVNVRGSGCSNGSYGFFEPVQTTDGYDVIEAVAAQPWVQHGHVGMVGISYPGISQLFVAQTQPPHLAAITPLSVLDDSYRSTLYPGGILNTGFAVNWSAERQASAEAFGQEWTVEMAKTDPVCAANQLQRGQNQDLLGEIERNPFYIPSLAEPIAPRSFVDKITVPVFLAGAWQDEQTGGRFPTMLDKFTGTDRLYVNLMNGLHTESLINLDTFGRFVEFLDLYVAKRAPQMGAAQVIAPILAGSISGVEGLALPERRSLGTDYAAALAAFEAEPPIEVLFEEGAADGQPSGSPLARFRATFDAWPVTDTYRTWYLQGGNELLDGPPTGTGFKEYRADPEAVATTTLEESADEWAADVVYNWQPNPEGTAAVWTTEPFAADTVIVGSGWVRLFVSSSSGDTDLEATITEIRPDGTEMYIQSGWLRASHGTETADSPADGPPVHSHEEQDVQMLGSEVDIAAPIRLELFPVAHAIRAGSRLRLTIDAPGGNRPSWAFDTISAGETVKISTSADSASSLHLPIVDGITVPAGVPACGALRGQPCR